MNGWPHVGEVLIYNYKGRDQAYTFTGEGINHTTRDGNEMTLYRWATLCAECGEPFDALLSLPYPTSFTKRRCDTCAAKYGKAAKLTMAQRREKWREKRKRQYARRKAAAST